MRIRFPKKLWGGPWVFIATMVFEGIDIFAKLLKEQRLRRQLEHEGELRDSRNYVLKKCLQILAERQNKANSP